MSDDDETIAGDLLELLEAVLDEAPTEPRPEHVAALRARARAARALHPPASRVRGPRAFAVAAVALLAGVAVGGVLVDRTSGPTSAGVVEYDGTIAGPDGEASAARLTVVRTGIGRVIELDTEELPILPAGEYYEVWFVAPDEGTTKRISAGTFHPDPDGRSSVRFAAAVDPTKYPTVEITAEPGDGNPASTGPVVLRATIGR